MHRAGGTAVDNVAARPRAGVLVRMRDLLPRGGGLRAEDWNRRHRGLLAILWLHVAAVPGFALAQGYGVGHALLEGSLLVIAAVAASWGPLGRTARAAVVSVGLLSASAMLVHFSGGYIEFHFHFFVMIALLSLYQHWLPFLAAVAYVGVHHGLAGALDPGAVFNHPDAIAHPWKWAGIHAAFVLAAGAANVFIWRVSEEEQKHRREIELVTEAALAHLPLQGLLDEVLARVRSVLGTDVATVALREEGEAGLTIRAVGGAVSPLPGPQVTGRGGVVARVIASRGPVVVDAAGEEDLDNPVHREAGVAAVAAVPLLVEGRAIGVLDVGSCERRHFDADDVSLLQLVADRIAPAIDRARLHDREHRIAETLQRSLLPKAMPARPGVELAFRYRPAGEGIAVGGDWYDAVELPSKALGLAMGDVVGHGTDAASLMGQLRTGLRAYALEGHGPAEVLSRLDDLTCSLGETNMATLLYLELRPEEGTLRYASAGHPAAVAVGPDGAVTRLDGGRGMPLGTGIGAGYRTAEIGITPGSTIVLFTDGLVECAKTGLDQGLRRLEDVLAEHREADPEVICDQLLERVPPEHSGSDDVALLVVKLAASLGEVLEVDYPARPESAGSLRSTLERWLAEHGVREQEAFDIVTASSEAAANAIEHAYGAQAAAFRLVAHRENGDVALSVRDAGSWREPRGANRGRGLSIMRALMDEVQIDRTAAGTTVSMRKRVSG